MGLHFVSKILGESLSLSIYIIQGMLPFVIIGDYILVACILTTQDVCTLFRMRPVINFLSYFTELRNRPTTLLVSTTGDTGPAAVHAVNDASNPLLTILVHYPYGQISDFQRRQLTTLQSDFVKVASFEGGGDDMDWPIKETLLSSKNGGGGAEGGRMFCGINSYNIGRPLVQMTLFIWIYLRMAEKLGLSPGDESRYPSSCIVFVAHLCSLSHVIYYLEIL
jgi:threonine synthase